MGQKHAQRLIGLGGSREESRWTLRFGVSGVDGGLFTGKGMPEESRLGAACRLCGVECVCGGVRREA